MATQCHFMVQSSSPLRRTFYFCGGLCGLRLRAHGHPGRLCWAYRASGVIATSNVTLDPLSVLPSQITGIAVLQAVDLHATPSVYFAKAVTVQLTFPALSGSPAVVFWNGETRNWQRMTNVTVNPSADTVTFTTSHCSVFAVGVRADRECP